VGSIDGIEVRRPRWAPGRSPATAAGPRAWPLRRPQEPASLPGTPRSAGGAPARPEIFLSAGEASGDLYAGMLARALRRGGARVRGFGGPAMRAAGAAADPVLFSTPVMGWTGAARHLFRFWSLLRRTRADWVRRRPDALVLIDYPGFNLRLARIAARLGIPTYYFVCPQVWAWGANRLLLMRRVLRRTFPVLPFEEPLHQAFGIASSFLGHPILDALPRRPAAAAAARRTTGVAAGRPHAVLLPGSRPSEVDRILPVLLGAAARAARRAPRLAWVVVAAPGVAERVRAAVALRAGDGETPAVAVAEDPAFALRATAAFAWTASGTASLELGLLGVPQAVVYRGAPLNWWIARRLVRVPHVSLVNLVLGRRAVPELLQGAATAEAVAATAPRLARGRAAARRIAAELRARLGRPGAASRVARAILADVRARTA
jgi:lipid-A-disaccharide synthase